MSANLRNSMLTVGEAARELRCSRVTIWRMVKRGELKRYQRGKIGPTMFRRADVAGIFRRP